MYDFLDTPLGKMVAVGDEKTLHSLCFYDEIVQLDGVQGQTASIRSIEEELRLYFQGKLREFLTPIQLAGTAFQKAVWTALRRISYGETRSYAEIAASIGRPLAVRAVGNANGKNPFSILIPCHRVIQKDGKLGGYSAGLERKKWLLEHENS